MLQIEAQEHDPAHTHLQQCVPMHSRFQTPIGYKVIFVCPCYYFAPSSPRHYFFASIVIFFTPPRQTNERTVTLLFSRHAHLLLTITNFMPFASVLILLTLDRLRR
jgi:hypothetical protein